MHLPLRLVELLLMEMKFRFQVDSINTFPMEKLVKANKQVS